MQLTGSFSSNVGHNSQSRCSTWCTVLEEFTDSGFFDWACCKNFVYSCDNKIRGVATLHCDDLQKRTALYISSPCSVLVTWDSGCTHIQDRLVAGRWEVPSINARSRFCNITTNRNVSDLCLQKAVQMLHENGVFHQGQMPSFAALDPCSYWQREGMKCIQIW